MANPPTTSRKSLPRKAEDGQVERKLVRIPKHIMRIMKAMAARDRRSVNAQIVYALEQSIRNDRSKGVVPMN